MSGFIPTARAVPPPPPTPQESRFVADMKNAGVSATNGHDSTILSIGYTLCMAHWRDGGLAPTTMDMIRQQLKYRDFNQIMAMALQDLCPSRSGWGGYPGAGV